MRAAGAVAIADEIQVGLGRVGTALWAFQLDGRVPDIVTMGKPLGNGHPLGAVVTTRAIADAFDNGMEYFNTFGGNPVSAAVGLAVLDVIEDEGCRRTRARAGPAASRASRPRRPPRRSATSAVSGLFVGVELVADRETREPATELAAALVKARWPAACSLATEGPGHDMLKIKPHSCSAGRLRRRTGRARPGPVRGRGPALSR